MFGADANPGVFLYAAFLTFYVADYFVFERVQPYTYDVIHERLGFKMLWGGLMVYGWLYILPLWGMAVYPDPGFSSAWTYFWLIGSAALFLFGWGIARGANMQKYTFKRWSDRKFLGLIEPRYIEAGDRKILCSGLWGVARHFNYLGEGFFSLSIALVFGHFANPWAWTYFVFIVGLFISRQRLDDEVEVPVVVEVGGGDIDGGVVSRPERDPGTESPRPVPVEDEVLASAIDHQDVRVSVAVEVGQCQASRRTWASEGGAGLEAAVAVV